VNASRHLILVKHALPVPEPSVPAREWRLGAEGEAQAARLAAQLCDYEPFALFSSNEPKAARTAELMGPATAVDALREIDRPILPWMGTEEHKAFNKRLFEDVDVAVVGDESAADALERFEDAVVSVCDGVSDKNVVAVAHGTVVALFVAHHNAGVDAYDLWQELDCASFVVLALPGFALLRPAS
jgi:broad specificity phosphatase PhoE